MAKNRSSFNMLPDDIVTENNDVTQPSNVTHVTSVTQENNVTQPINVIPAQQVEHVSQPKPIAQVQLPIQSVMPKQPKTRVYVNIKTDNYEYVKKECGALGIKMQDFFDALIEKYRQENKQHFID